MLKDFSTKGEKFLRGEVRHGRSVQGGEVTKGEKEGKI